jgi:propionyl-CoA carboxylase alpha chain
MTINRLLVANRGEIARRVFRTCRDLGIETVAVFSDADAGLPFVAEADAAVALPGSAPADTYLRGDLIVAAARAAGADAIHPGYGFLSESADFARQVLEAGLTWVGPPPESIEQMGSKIEAKKLVAEVGVPVLAELAPGELTARDLPVLVKASAGGGGRGMRVVRDLADVAAQVELATSEAASAFGDSTVFCEPYVERGRHIEVQVLVDAEGNVCALGERDCSIQRRHQKVVEETPAPGISDDTRKAMFRAASLVAASARYLGAGTVEFLYEPETERFWFLEMNTRLQVEHPITECVTGVDLVAAQIALAEGRPLHEIIPSGPRGESPWPDGHAIEVRLYAEDPAADWQPQSGTLTRFEMPDVAAEFSKPAGHGIRLDSGLVSGDEVGTHYDAMLAKVIAWAPTREQAVRRLAGALSRARIHGVRTNRDLLVNVLRHDAFAAGAVSTDFFARNDLARLATPNAAEVAVELSALAATIALAERDLAGRDEQRRIPVAWRNVPSQPQRTRFAIGSEATSSGEVTVEWHGGRTGYRSATRDDVHVVEAGPDRVTLTELSDAEVAIAAHPSDKSGVRRAFEVFVDGDRVDVESSLGHVALRRLPRFVDPADQVATGSLLAPMPGTVVRVDVAHNDTVSAGQAVLVLEAMKMQHTVTAPHDGVVTEIPVAVGQQVASGAVLAVVQAPESAAPEGENQ